MNPLSAFHVILGVFDSTIMKRNLFLLFVICFTAASTGQAQRIFYSEPDRDDVRNMKFELLGKYNNQYLVYKNARNNHSVVIYTPDMMVKEKVPLDFIPERAINVDVFSNQEFSLVIYQFQKKNVVYCMGVKIDGNGKKVGEPLELDTTHIGTFASNKIYSVISSDDKQKLMVFKMRNRIRDDFEFQTLLLSNNLIPIRRAGFTYVLENTKEAIADFYLDNEGNFLFTHVKHQVEKEYISMANLCVLPVYGDSVLKHPLTLNGVFLDELRIKVDNNNGRYILASFYSKAKRGTIDGLYIAVVGKDAKSTPLERVMEFDDEMRRLARGESSTKNAFNDYYLKHFIVRKDGGVLMTAESMYTNTRGNNFNRWDNPYLWGSPWGFGPGTFWGWNPYNTWGWGGWGSPWGWNSFGGSQTVRYYADNVLLFSFDKEANLQWKNIMAKSQFDDNTDNLISYQIMNSGAELLFLYNEWNRRSPMLSAQSLTADGQINRQQPLRSLDKGYEFMIRYAKQVAAREMLTPVMYRSTIGFARIEF